MPPRITGTDTGNNLVYVTVDPHTTTATAALNNWVHVTTATPFTTTAATTPIINTTAPTIRMDETYMEEAYGFQVGDVVRIKDRNKIPDDVYFGWDENMEQWCGQEFVIAEIKGHQEEPRLIFQDASEEMKGYFWGADMVELVSPIESKELSNEAINDWNKLMNQI